MSENYIENPFVVIQDHLNRLEGLVLEIKEANYHSAKSPINPSAEPPIKMPELCRLLQISDTTARAWMTKGTLPFHRKGNRVFFFKSEVLKSFEQPLTGRKEGKDVTHNLSFG